jgi:hypothetical protein
MSIDPDEVQNAIKGLKVGKAPCRNVILNRALKHLPMQAVLLLGHIFNAILLIHVSPVWKNARVISILKPWMDPAQLSSCRSISLLEMIGTLIEKIMLTRVLHQLGECGLLSVEMFVFRPGLYMSVLLKRLVNQ